MAIGRPLGSKNRTTQELALDLKIKKKKMELKVLEEKKKHAREAEKIAVPLAAVITTTAMLGSLYFSEVVHYIPCRLCWYQRSAMYPLAIFLLVASFKKLRHTKLIAVILAGVGGTVSTYHWFLERFPNLDAGVCDVKVPCEFIWFQQFGFVTLPFMAFTAFVGTIVLVTLPPLEKR